MQKLKTVTELQQTNISSDPNALQASQEKGYPEVSHLKQSYIKQTNNVPDEVWRYSQC